MPTSPRRTQRRRAFTLVELLVVVVVLGLLALVGSFAYNQVTESSRKHAARMMAIHFAHDASGVAAGKQQPVGALHEASDEGLADVAGDTDGSKVGVEYGTVNATTRDVVAGVSYLGYCTPVLFVGSSPAHAVVGTTIKTTSSCKTDDGVPPTGDPLLDPTGGSAGGAGGSGGSGGSGGPAVLTLHGSAINTVTLPSGTQVGDLIVFGAAWTGGLPTYCNDPRLSRVHPEATWASAEAGMWVGTATTLDPLVCSTPYGLNTIATYAGGLVPDGSAWVNSSTAPFSPATVTAKAAVAFVATRNTTVTGFGYVTAPWQSAVLAPGTSSILNAKQAYWSDPSATSAPALGAYSNGSFTAGTAIVLGLKAGSPTTSSFAGLGHDALAFRTASNGVLTLPAGTQVGDTVVLGADWTGGTATSCTDPRLSAVSGGAGPKVQGGMWIGTATTLDPLACTSPSGVRAIAVFYNAGSVVASNSAYSITNHFGPPTLPGHAAIAVFPNKGSTVPGFSNLSVPWNLVVRGEPGSSNIRLGIGYWRDENASQTAPIDAWSNGIFDAGTVVQVTLSH